MNEQATMKQPNSFYFSTSSNKAPGILGKVVAFIMSLTLFALAFMFSLAALAVVAVVGILFAGWFWWKTRALRQQLRTASGSSSGPAGATRHAGGGHIIEGEAVRENDDAVPSGKLLP